MIPLRDNNPSERFPFVNVTIIVVCVVAFFYQLMLGRHMEAFLFEYGLVPARYFDRSVAAHFTVGEQALPFLTTMFLHGGWLHLIGNMWILYIFGDNVESALGHAGYLFFYLMCGIMASLIHLVLNFNSSLPTIGASGAIAGIMGAYFVLYPRARILTFVPIFFFFTLIEVPAFVFLGFWFVMQFFSGAFALAGGNFSGIAWWAHIGGFVAGILLLFLFRRERRSRTY